MAMAMPRYPKSMSQDAWRGASRELFAGTDTEQDPECERERGFTAQMSVPDRAALRDLGSFGSSCRERLNQEEASCCDNDEGFGTGRDAQAGCRSYLDVPDGTVIKLRLICASGIHQGNYFSFMAPCAVMSTESSEDVFVTRPADKGSDTFPVWNAVATFEVRGRDLVPVEASPVSKIRKTAPKLVLRKAEPKSGKGTGGSSPNQQQALVQQKSPQRTGKLGRSRSARLCPYPSSFPDVKVSVYSSEKLKQHLGSAKIPIRLALETPGTPVLGSFELTRKGFLGAHIKEGHLRAIIVALPLGQTDFME